MSDISPRNPTLRHQVTQTPHQACSYKASSTRLASRAHADTIAVLDANERLVKGTRVHALGVGSRSPGSHSLDNAALYCQFVTSSHYIRRTMAMRSPNRNTQTPKQHVLRAAGGLSFVIGQKQKDDNDSTDRQSPPQRMPNDLPGYEGLVWRNVTKQKFRIPENDRSRLDSWVWKQKHGWRVWDNTGEEYWLCKICHGRRSTNKH